MAFESDAPTGLLRRTDGRYVAYHRVAGFGRRMFRSESHDFVHWSSPPQLVMEQDAADPPQTQFYGVGVTQYGAYEIGTLWIYRTEEGDWGGAKMRGLQTPELVYSREGTAWHRAAQGTPFVPNGAPGEWDAGNLQPASQMVFLDDEIRCYYAGTDARHEGNWEAIGQHAGLGTACLKPDRFIALRAGDQPAEMMTVLFKSLGDAEFYVNVRTARDGVVRLEVLDAEANPLPGRTESDCVPITGDHWSHKVMWRGDPEPLKRDRIIRMRLTAQRASVYAIATAEPDETSPYHRFQALV
jgi:hypothetical protein